MDVADLDSIDFSGIPLLLRNSVQKESPSKEAIAHALRNSFGHGRVLVVGDLMLDRYLWGTVNRISPEAPTPVLSERRESVRAGGAGNVALNIAGLGLGVAVAGFVGKDEGRKQLRRIFAEQNVDTKSIIELPNRLTTIKTRVIAGHQHVLRLDSEDLSVVDDRHYKKLTNAVLARLQVDAVILSDYGKRVLSGPVCQQIIEAANQNDTPVLVKPKGTEFAKYAGASVMVMNQAELANAVDVSPDDTRALFEAATETVRIMQLDFIVVTRGADGITLVAEGQTIHSPTTAREVFDVSGAADTAIAAVAAAMLGGLDYVDLLHTVNLAAGLVVARIGTVAVDRASLLHQLHAEDRRPIAAAEQLDEFMPLVDEWREQKCRIVFADGSFDGIHAGHVAYLQMAARRGDKLVVGVNSDKSVRESTGNKTPRYSQIDRAAAVAALLPVDAVILCGENASAELMKTLKPDGIVPSMDENGSTIADAE